MTKIYFFGWTNIKWLLRQLLALASDKPSELSLKRVNQMSAMVIFFCGWITVFHVMILNDIKYPQSLNIGNYIAWSAPILGIAGYYLTKTEKSKTIYNKDQQIANTEVK